MNYFGKLLDDFLSPPINYGEDGKRIIGSYLKVILLVTIAILPVYVVIKRFVADRFYPADFILLGLVVFLIVLFYIITKGRVMLAGILFLLSAWTALTFMAAYADGINDIAIVGYFVVIFLATLLTGIRFAFVITALSIISVWIMGIIHLKNGFVPKGDEPLNYSRDYTVLFILVLTSIILFARSYKYSYDRINRELKERIKAEEKLSKNELTLKERNEELYMRNLQTVRINEELMAAKEKAEESDRLKTAFLQNISHEIRTPMNGIVGFLDLLQHPDIDEVKKSEYISIINSCTQQLAALVNDLIDISKIESGAIDLQISDFRVDQLLGDIEKMFSKNAAEKRLKFAVTNLIPVAVVKSDNGKIKQVLANLVSNAIKFTSRGSVTVQASKDGDNLVISVSDTGIGIKKSDYEIIFDRFRQSEIGLNRSYGGSGLGLAISKGNINFLGGTVMIESEPGKGSTFTFSVPVIFLNETADYTNEIPDVEFPRLLKIMIAEDDDINFLYVRELLRESNCELIRTRDGEEAIEVFSKTNDIDVILMDLKMPGMNGYEATQRIKQMNPVVPVIAVSAFKLHPDLLDSTGACFDGHIVKPVDKNILCSKIISVLK
jgi:signal transduction histidine kinase